MKAQVFKHLPGARGRSIGDVRGGGRNVRLIEGTEVRRGDPIEYFILTGARRALKVREGMMANEVIQNEEIFRGKSGEKDVGSAIRQRLNRGSIDVKRERGKVI